MTPVSPARRGARRAFRQRLLIAFLFLMLIPYVRQLVSSPTAGQDYRAFRAAAVVLARGGDPYSWPEVAATEALLYNAPGNLQPGDPAYYDFQPFPEGPWLASALEPLATLPWRAGYIIFDLVIGLALAAAAWWSIGLVGMRGRRRRVVFAGVMLSPVAFLNFFQGQITPVVFVAFAASWLLCARGRGVLGGLVLAAVWVKPNLGLMLPVVIAVLEPRQARRSLLGFVLGSSILTLAAALALGPTLFHWPIELLQHWRAVQGPQPDVASIHSFYYPALTGGIKTAALGLVILAVAAYGVWALRRAPDARTRGLTILLLWIAALPYVHSFDTILLIPVIVALIGPRLEGFEDPVVELTIWTFLLIPLAYFVGLHIGFFNGFSAIAVAVLLIAWHRRMLQRAPQADLEAIAA
jgi:hypothetical protein